MENAIRDTIVELINENVADRPIRPEENLFSIQNGLQYTDMVYVRMLVERQFGVKFSLDEYENENFFTVDGLAAAVEAKRKEAGKAS